MLIPFGRRPTSEGLVDLLLECHHRIRTFLGAAHGLAAGDHTDEDEAIVVAGDIRRYFTQAFPLHLADEDDELVPRLRDTNATVDRALATMSADHVAHAALVHELVERCTAIVERRPRAPGFVAMSAALATALEPHLALEERVIFPAVARLAPSIQDAIVLAMRARRGA